MLCVGKVRFPYSMELALPQAMIGLRLKLCVSGLFGSLSPRGTCRASGVAGEGGSDV